MHSFRTGDLVAIHKNEYDNTIIKIGIIIKEEADTFFVKWTSYNKNFFMEKQEDIFRELNNMYLLSLQSFDRNDASAFLSLLSAS